MRWYTCTPRRFAGNRTFFDRDSGLTSVGFRSLGVESMAIMPGPAAADDLPELIRATDAQLRDRRWWQALNLDGVVFYGWGESEYAPVAEAIAAAGIRLMQVTDTNGISSPFTGFRDYLATPWQHQWWDPLPKKILRALFKIPYGFTVQLCKDRAMVRLIGTGDFFLCAIPEAAKRTRRLTATFGSPETTAKVRFMPMPIQSHFVFEAGDEKVDEVIAVGRWDSPQKRQALLMETIGLTARMRPATRFRIFGAITTEMKAWHEALPEEIAVRVILEGQRPNPEIAHAYRRARVMLVTAAYEGCHNSSAEAICSGCSVVGIDTPYLMVLAWHASHDSGRLSPDAAPKSVADTLVTELETWDAGDRDPQAISNYWRRILHPDCVARAILQLAAESPSSPSR